MTNSFLTMAGAAAPLAAWFCSTDLKTGYVISPYRFLLATILNSLSKITKDLLIPREGEFESLESDFLGYVSLLPTHNHFGHQQLLFFGTTVQQLSLSSQY